MDDIIKYKIIFVILFIIELINAEYFIFDGKPNDFKICEINKPTTFNISLNNNFFQISNVTLKYLLLNNTNGHYYFDSNAASSTTTTTNQNYIDELIYYLLYQYQFNLSPPKPNLKCAEFLTTYLCTYTFVEVNKKPCNDICEAVINKCSKELIITNFQVIPNESECIKNGTLAEESIHDGRECSLISLISSKSLESWWTSQSINVNDVNNYIKYPGGVVRGSVLGFGVLLSIGVIVATLHFIMKYQDKIV